MTVILRKAAIRFAGLPFAGLLLAGLILAQTYTGGITGVITDPGGAVIPGASLRLTNLDTNDTRQQQSNDVGAFNFTALTPGRYRLEVEHPGFKRYVQEPIEVRVQQFLTLSPKLEVGQETQSIEVTGQAALLDAATSR